MGRGKSEGGKKETKEREEGGKGHSGIGRGLAISPATHYFCF